MKSKNVLIGCAIVVSALFLVFTFASMMTSLHRGASEASVRKVFHTGGGSRIGLMYVSGIISAGRSAPSGFMSESTSGSDSIVKTLRNASLDDGIKVIVIRINSPGGSAAGSQEIYNEIMRIRKEGKKQVFISMGDVAASGGYYIASAANHIVANPATMTGSIGVIMKYMTYQGLMDKIGVEPVVIKAGEMKDIGSPYRDLTPEERELLDSMTVNIHEQFISDVAQGRGLEIEQVRAVADGRILTGEQALGAELVDSVGGLQDTLELAAEKSGLSLPPEVELLQKDSPFSFLFNTMGEMKQGASAERVLQKISEIMLLNPILSSQN